MPLSRRTFKPAAATLAGNPALFEKLPCDAAADFASVGLLARLQTLALESLPGTPEQLAAYARSERERWGKLIRERGLKLD